MSGHGYKKYMKKNSRKDYSLIKIFLFSFIGMLLVFTYLIKTLSPSVDVSIGDYKQEQEIPESALNVDGRLTAIQDEDRGRDFSIMMDAVEAKNNDNASSNSNTITETIQPKQTTVAEALNAPPQDVVYKVYIGSYTSAEQAKVAKDIITETNSDLNPIVKCLGSNNYTLQIGIFKNKNSAEMLHKKILQNHLPARIEQE